MSLPATTVQSLQNEGNAELKALIETLGRRLEDARQELKSDIQSKLPSSRRFSWVLLFIAVQVVQGIIVVRYTVRAASTALDSANIPEMTSRYSEALKQSQSQVTALNANVATLSGLVSETSEAWKKHVQGFVRELPKVQEGYERAAARFTSEASTLPTRIVDRFFEADEVKRSLAAYAVGVDSAAGTVQARSDAGLESALRNYENKIASPEGVAHFEKQVARKFDESKEKIAETVAAGMKEAVAASQLKDKLAGFWDAGLQEPEAAKAEGWLYKRLRSQAEEAAVDQSLVHAVDVALLPPLQAWFNAQLKPDGPLALQLARDQAKVPALPQLVTELVKRKVDAAIGLPDGQKPTPLDDVLREVVRSRVNVTLSALQPAKGPVVLTCK